MATLSVGSWSACRRSDAAAGGWLPWAVASAVLMLLSSVSYFYWDYLMVEPYRQWVRMLPAAALGVAIAQVPQGVRSARVPAAIIGAITVASALTALAFGWREVPSRYVAMCSYICIAWCIPIVAPRWLLAISQLTFGVYLVHFFMLLIGYKLEATYSFRADPWTRGLAATVMSFCFVPFLRYTRLRWMVGIWSDAYRRRVGCAPELAASVGKRSRHLGAS